jgi:hypothetical protein
LLEGALVVVIGEAPAGLDADEIVSVAPECEVGGLVVIELCAAMAGGVLDDECGIGDVDELEDE